MAYEPLRKKKIIFLSGVFLLFGSAVFWISHIIAMANNFDRWDDAVLSAALVTSLPVIAGLLGIWYGKKSVK